MTPGTLRSGDVVIVDFGRGIGREQGGARPAVVISSPGHLRMATGLATVVPCTSTMRGWASHVEVVSASRLPRRTFAMTEQVRTVSPDRIRGTMGRVHPHCLQDIADTLRSWIIQPPRFRR